MAVFLSYLRWCRNCSSYWFISSHAEHYAWHTVNCDLYCMYLYIASTFMIQVDAIQVDAVVFTLSWSTSAAVPLRTSRFSILVSITPSFSVLYYDTINNIITINSWLIMAALCNRAGHHIFALWFLSFFLSFFLLLSFFSSPNLSGCRLDVYHTSAHGVALVRIQNAGLKCASCGSLEIQDAKNRNFGTIAQLCRAISSELRHVSTIGKKTVKQQYLLHMSW